MPLIYYNQDILSMSKIERDIAKCAELMERKRELETEISEFPFAVRAQARYGMLVPCPICGKPPEMEDMFSSIRVVCWGCHISFSAGWCIATPVKEAIDGWNRNAAQISAHIE